MEIKGKERHWAWDLERGHDVMEYFAGGLDDPGFISFHIEPESVRLIVPGDMNEQELLRAWFI